MSEPLRILVLGASYGSLFGTKCAAGGHFVSIVCLPAEVDAINRDGARISMPLKAGGRVNVDSRHLPGRIFAGSPADFDPRDFDLVVLAMQEPQYCAEEIRSLLRAVSKARIPCLSLMNMPPPPYLHRIPGIDVSTLRNCYTDLDVWNSFDPDLMTLASPDPQAVRLPGLPANHLHVRLATNFRVAGFRSDAHTALLRRLERDIDVSRYEGAFELPVKLRVHDSIFVPLGKWCMLLTGNYRCVLPDEMLSIGEAVHRDLDASRSVYEWVGALCRRLGAGDTDLVAFDKYAAAALSLESPSSAARALASGAQWIERTDRLIQILGRQQGMRSPVIDDIVSCVDGWIVSNRRMAAEAVERRRFAV